MRKIIVFIIAVLMVVTMLPLTALADGAYSVTYDANGANGGTVPVDSAAYNAGDSVAVSANTGSLIKTGFIFNGWNTAVDGTGTAYAENSVITMPEGNVTLYAQWAVISCTVKFDTQGGTPVADWTGNSGDIITDAPVTTYEGYDFAGWYIDAAFISQVTFPYTVWNSATLYAKWAPKSAYISSVFISAGTLSREFSKTVYSYKIKLAETENTVTITPFLENANAKLQMWTNKDHTAVTSQGITVNVDNNKTVTVKIKVTYAAAVTEGAEAEDAVTAGTEDEDAGNLVHVYTFVIKRDKSTDATLKSLAVSAGVLSPAFDPAVTSYTLSLDSSVKSVKIFAEANSLFAKVKDSITVKLKEGQTKTVTIRVKPQSGSAKLYTITVTRAKSDVSETGKNGGNKGGKGKGHNK